MPKKQMEGDVDTRRVTSPVPYALPRPDTSVPARRVRRPLVGNSTREPIPGPSSACDRHRAQIAKKLTCVPLGIVSFPEKMVDGSVPKPKKLGGHANQRLVVNVLASTTQVRQCPEHCITEPVHEWFPVLTIDSH